MRRTWTVIGVVDVAASLAWYPSLLGLQPQPPCHDYFGQVLDDDGTVLLCLHRWGDHEHPTLIAPAPMANGNGLLLFFRIDEWDRALQTARNLVQSLEEEPHRNPATGTQEFSLRDHDGYFVTLSATSADA